MPLSRPPCLICEPVQGIGEFKNSLTFFFLLIWIQPLPPILSECFQHHPLGSERYGEMASLACFFLDQGQEFFLGRKDEHKVKLASRALITPMKSAPNLAPLHTSLLLQRLNYRRE